MLHIYQNTVPPLENTAKTITTAYKSRQEFITVFDAFEHFLWTARGWWGRRGRYWESNDEWAKPKIHVSLGFWWFFLQVHAISFFFLMCVGYFLLSFFRTYRTENTISLLVFPVLCSVHFSCFFGCCFFIVYYKKETELVLEQSQFKISFCIN